MTPRTLDAGWSRSALPEASAATDKLRTGTCVREMVRPVRWKAVLFDRDGTLIRDVPYNGDPAAVEPVPGARVALDRLRAAGIQLGVVTNQSGIGRGLLTASMVGAVNARVDELLGPFDTWQVCPHDEAAGCACRKPGPGLVLAAAAALGTLPSRCVVVGDIGLDVDAGLAAGAAAVLVPTRVTRPEEVLAAPVVLPDLAATAAWVLGDGAVARGGSAPDGSTPGGTTAHTA
jgi:histidinol-phosphate phosphatase family protein